MKCIKKGTALELINNSNMNAKIGAKCIVSKDYIPVLHEYVNVEWGLQQQRYQSNGSYYMHNFKIVNNSIDNYTMY